VRRISVFGLIAVMVVLTGILAGCAPGVSDVDFSFTPGNAISCSSAKSCLAVGTTTSQAGNPTATADAWNGRAWRQLTVPLPAGATGALTGVSCKGGSCLAIGYYFPQNESNSLGLAVAWNGKTLKAIPAAPPAGGENEQGAIDNVSCVSAKVCITMVAPMSGRPVIDTWNGHAWRARRANDPGNVGQDLDTISCVSAKYCVFGGTAEPTEGSKTPVLAVWNGTTIKPMKTPTPAGTDVPTDYGPPVIYRVACVSKTSCAAVGTYLTDSSATTGFGFAEVLTGKTWKESTIKWPAGISLSMLFGLSCTSATSCIATGTAGSASGGIFATTVSYNGETWTPSADPPEPAKGNSDYFADIACPTATRCVAAGQVGPAPSFAPFSSASAIFGSWRGESWRLLTAK